MTIGNALAWDDTVLPFQLDRTDMRGRVARLDGVLDQILRQHAYPAPVEALVSEAAILTALIGQTMKLRWRFSLQVRGTGPVKMVATDYYGPASPGEPARMRAWASFDETVPATADPYALLGDGYFSVIIDQGQDMQPYQGITPLTGASLAECAEVYFAQSEQLPTRFAIRHGRSQMPGDVPHWRAGGVMIQHMPATGGVRADQGSGDGGLLTHTDILGGDEGEDWTRINLLLDTLEPLELIGPQLAPTDLLVRLFHEEGPRVYDAQPVRFGCSCSAEKVRHSLSIYSPREIAQMLTPAGILTADCQFCGAHYEFDPATLGNQADAHG